MRIGRPTPPLSLSDPELETLKQWARQTTIRNYIDINNEAPKPFIWTKTADEILASVARFCQRTLESVH